MIHSLCTYGYSTIIIFLAFSPESIHSYHAWTFLIKSFETFSVDDLVILFYACFPSWTYEPKKIFQLLLTRPLTTPFSALCCSYYSGLCRTCRSFQEPKNNKSVLHALNWSPVTYCGSKHVCLSTAALDNCLCGSVTPFTYPKSL